MRIFITSFAVILFAGCATPPDHQTASSCYRASTQEIADQFELWNAALQTGQPQTVVARYSSDSILLPTLSNTVRVTADAKIDYFNHFLEKRPVGAIDEQHIIIECNAAINTGLYTFTFGDGSVAKARYTYTYRRDGKNWLITSHHSSLMPESN